MISSLVDLPGVRLEVKRVGQGRPLLLLCSEESLELEAPLLQSLAGKYEVIIPSPPGFGRSERPEWVTGPDDISYFYLDLVEKLALEKAVVVGASFGGWIAAEMATKDDSFISKLDPGQSLWRQVRRPDRARHRGYLDAAGGRGAAAQMVRPRERGS